MYNYVKLAMLYCSVLILFFFNIDNGFFWDGVQLGSRHAHYYLETNFSNLILPSNIDSGHVPAFGIYLALIWKYIGKSIVISHLAVLPFIIGIIYQLNATLEFFVPKKHAVLASFLVLLNSTLLSQLTMVMPDILLVFFFLWALNSIIVNNYKILPLIIVFLFLTSMRGMMISFCLMLFDFYLNIDFTTKKTNVFKKVISRGFIYLPALCIFILFSIYHYNQTGWVGYHKDSPWSVNFEKTNALGFLINILKLGLRQIEFGKIGFWIVAFILVVKNHKTMIRNKATVNIIILYLLFILVFPLNMLWAKSLLNSRYMIPSYILFSILTVHLLFTYPVKKYQKTSYIIIIVLAFLIGGVNVYKKSYNQTWDSTLAHLPYFKLRHSAIEYLKSEDIKLEDVGTFFPNIASLEMIDLNGDISEFKEFDGSNNYVLCSNIYYNNDKLILGRAYKLIKRIENLGVEIRIYEKIN